MFSVASISTTSFPDAWPHGGGRAVRLLRRRGRWTWAAARHDPAHLVAHFRTARGSCRTAGMGFNLLLTGVFGRVRREHGPERRLRRTMARAAGMGVTAVTVAHPWLVSLARETALRVRVGVFVGSPPWNRPAIWETLGAQLIALEHPRAVSRSRRHQAHRRGRTPRSECRSTSAASCAARLARTHVAGSRIRLGAEPNPWIPACAGAWRRSDGSGQPDPQRFHPA